MKNKANGVRAHPFVGADDNDEEKYRGLLEKAAEEVSLTDSDPSASTITLLPQRERAG